MRDDGVDFGRLNAAERDVLGLLARGHTAKSIATITDRSVGSVNERLREARRKTGVGSSRELARLFAAQENRDELIGVAPVDPVAAEAVRPHRRFTLKRMSLMFAIAVPLAAAFAAWSSLSPQAAPDASFSATLPTDTKYWHTLFLSEKRDAQWAPAAEDSLRARFTSVPDLDTGDHPLSVRCAATVCEVRGVLSGTEERISAMMNEVQNAGLNPVRVGPPLANTSAGFAIADRTPTRVEFVMHYRRA
ncbi:helix-turn-helix domain-containing protein [Sphingomonas panacisoli]|uniref:helix-turn-helix domain-containing protein n=1 Tax=Sphingomonas panacisoli TaxID=1813879 RepID=UPI001F0024F0|nr:helix-turn-helix transcriptional regulator [Sphingomonas panacisoli]